MTEVCTYCQVGPHDAADHDPAEHDPGIFVPSGICGKPYTRTLSGGRAWEGTCQRDAGHDRPGYQKAFWPPPPDEKDREQMLVDYREHGYEDRSPF